MSAIVELSGTDVVHKARSGGLFARTEGYPADRHRPDHGRPRKDGRRDGRPAHPADNPTTTEAVT
ncbi:hypothetical protein ACWD11_27130 [Streptomyces sp. NPDC002776]